MNEEFSLNEKLSSEPRRRFIRKTIVTSLVVAQPALLTGLIRASAGEVLSTGGGETTKSTSTQGTTHTTVPE